MAHNEFLQDWASQSNHLKLKITIGSYEIEGPKFCLFGRLRIFGSKWLKWAQKKNKKKCFSQILSLAIIYIFVRMDMTPSSLHMNTFIGPIWALIPKFYFYLIKIHLCFYVKITLISGSRLGLEPQALRLGFKLKAHGSRLWFKP